MNALLERWRRLERRPLGPWLFSRGLAAMVPYSGTIAPRVVSLAARRSSVRIEDRRRVQNHLESIHAVALMNLGELASGLALLAALDDDRRAILVRFAAEFSKKARGPLVADGVVPDDVDLGRDGDVEVTATLRDASGDPVARVASTWRIGPRRS